jgi:hypothetical protein
LVLLIHYDEPNASKHPLGYMAGALCMVCWFMKVPKLQPVYQKRDSHVLKICKLYIVL